MIRNEKEYQVALRRLEQGKEVIKKQREALKKAKLTPKEIKRVVDPILSFHQGLVEEVEGYENAKG